MTRTSDPAGDDRVAGNGLLDRRMFLRGGAAVASIMGYGLAQQADAAAGIQDCPHRNLDVADHGGDEQCARAHLGRAGDSGGGVQVVAVEVLGVEGGRAGFAAAPGS